MCVSIDITVLIFAKNQSFWNGLFDYSIIKLFKAFFFITKDVFCYNTLGFSLPFGELEIKI